MLLVANLANTKWEKIFEITETLTNGYSFESTQRELSNEYQHDRVWMVFKDFLGFCTYDESIASALERLKHTLEQI